MKDEHNSRWPQRQPGPLAPLLGATVTQFMALNTPLEVTGTWGTAPAKLFAEQLTPQSADDKILMRWAAPRSWLDGQPAAVTRTIGRGSISYNGAWLDEPGMTRAVTWMLTQSNATPDTFSAPEGIEVYHRTAPTRDVYIVENFAHAPQSVTLPTPMQNVLTGQTTTILQLPVYGVAVLTHTK